MKKREELSKVVSEWNETHPNRKDQPTLYFVMNKLLQNIVDTLEFDVFEENNKVLKFKCINFPIIGELELKKKNDNLFLLLDLNPYSLVIDGEERSKEYTITAFKDDYRQRVAEFIFLHYAELKTLLDHLYASYSKLTIDSLYAKEIDTQFVLHFNYSYNKYECFLNNIHSCFNKIIGTEFFSNPIYGLTDNFRCVLRVLYKYGSISETSDGVSNSNITVRVDAVPVAGKLENRNCFDAVYSFVKERLKEQYKEYTLKDLENGRANIFGEDIQCYSFPDTLILNETTFENIFPDRLFPEWSLMWGMCSIYITEDISDGHVLFIRSSDNMKNAICIDKENNRYYVNETSKVILAFNVSTKSKDELVTITDRISTGSILYNSKNYSWLSSAKVDVETTVIFLDGSSEVLFKTEDPFYQLVPSVTYLYDHANKLEKSLEEKLKNIKSNPCLIMTTMNNPEHGKEIGKYIGVSDTFFDKDDDKNYLTSTIIKDNIKSSFLQHINVMKNKHRDCLLKNPNKTLYDISPDTLFCVYGSIYNDIKKDIQIKRKELNLEIEDHIRLTMYFGKQDKLNHRNTLLMSTLLNVYFLMKDRVVDEIIISDSQQKYQMDTKLLESVTESMRKFGAEDNFEFSYDVEVL